MSRKIEYYSSYYAESLNKKWLEEVDLTMDETDEDWHLNRKNNFFNIFFLSTSIIIFIFPIISIMIIKIDDFQETLFVFIGNSLLILTYVLILISIGIIILSSSNKNSNVSRYENLQLPYETFKRQLKAQRAVLVINTLMSMLGLGDSVFDLTRLADHILSIVNKSYTSNTAYALLIISIFENGFKCMYHLCLLVFIIYHKKYENVLKYLIIRIFVGSLSICCLSQWLFIIFQEIYHEKKNNYFFANRTICSVNTSSLNSFSEVERFLFPLGIEFRISCFIELFFISLSKRRSENLLIKIFFNNTKTQRHTKASQEINQEETAANNENSRFGHLTIIVSMLISIIIVSVSIVVIFFQDNNIGRNSNLVIAISEICETVFMVTSSIYIIFLLLKMHNSHIHKMTNDKKIDFIFLFISQIALIIFCLLASLGSIKSVWTNDRVISNYVLYLVLTRSITALIQSILQSICIWIIRYKIVLDKSYIKILILLNFGIWLFDTFSAIKYETSIIQRDVYGRSGWEILSTIFIPLSIFYRLHSAIVLIKLKAETYSSNTLLIND